MQKMLSLHYFKLEIISVPIFLITELYVNIIYPLQNGSVTENYNAVQYCIYLCYMQKTQNNL